MEIFHLAQDKKRVKVKVVVISTPQGNTVRILNGHPEELVKLGLNPAEYPPLGKRCDEILHALMPDGTVVHDENYTKPTPAVDSAPGAVNTEMDTTFGL